VTRRPVTYSATAGRDLVGIIDFIAQNAGSRVAARWRRNFVDRINALSDQPYLGATDQDLGAGRRRLVLAPYLIVYEMAHSDGVHILRIIHGARDIPSLFEGLSDE